MLSQPWNSDYATGIRLSVNKYVAVSVYNDISFIEVCQKEQQQKNNNNKQTNNNNNKVV